MHVSEIREIGGEFPTDLGAPPTFTTSISLAATHHSIHRPLRQSESIFILWYRPASMCLSSQPLAAPGQRLLVAVSPLLTRLRKH
jgi:hypothetical protein